MKQDYHASDIIMLRSRLTPIEIAYRMRELVGHNDDAQPVDGLIGNGSEKEFSLYRADKPDNVMFHAALIEEDGGTLIDGRFGEAMSRYDRKVTLGCWGLFALILVGGGIATYFTPQSAMGISLVALGILIAAIAFMIVGDPLRRRINPDSRARIVEFLHKHLDIVTDRIGETV